MGSQPSCTFEASNVMIEIEITRIADSLTVGPRQGGVHQPPRRGLSGCLPALFHAF